jgi:putative ABC transport system permease protein
VPNAAQLIPDVRLALDNLLGHKLRTLLTMLGMIFGVSAVVAMLSIGAGAQQKAIAFIEEMGTRNIIVEAREAPNWEAMQKTRKTSQGLTIRDYDVIRQTVPAVEDSTPRKKFFPAKILPKPRLESPVVYGVNPFYADVASLQVRDGRFFGDSDERSAVPVCVLGAAAKENIFGSSAAVGEFLKLDEQWFRIVGVVSPRMSPPKAVADAPTEDGNNIIYAPLSSILFRVADSQNYFKDEIDAIYLRLASTGNIPLTAAIVRRTLDVLHHATNDFTVVVPSELLAQRRRTEQLFNTVMVAIASISLLVGGIGIMNIMLAALLERTQEIGLRRAVGATRSDIVKQFLTEAVLLSFAGGSAGVVLGVALAELIAWLAGWSTLVTPWSVLVAFILSVAVGLIFGTYPAMRAARLDPVEAIRYE